MMPKKENYTPRELAAHLGGCVQHWLNLINSGQLLAVDLRSSPEKKHFYRVPRAALEDYLRRRSAEPKPPAPTVSVRPPTLNQLFKQFIEREARRAIARQLREIRKTEQSK